MKIDLKTEPLRRLMDLQLLRDLRTHEQTRLMALGVAVGALGGLAASVLSIVVHLLGGELLGSATPSVLAPDTFHTVAGPLIGGLLIAVTMTLLPDGRPRGIADVIYAVGARSGALSLRDGLASGLAAAAALGAGHSGGREGPVVQLASAVTSSICRTLDLSPSRVRTLVAAGAASGIAASFNAPLGAAFFAMEILLSNFAMEGFAPIIAATVSGTVVGQALLGDRLALQLPPFAVEHYGELLLYPLLGVLCGLVALSFQRLMLWSAAQWDRLPLPAALRPLVAALPVIALGLLGVHQVMGNGYAYLEQLLSGGGGPTWLLLAILVAKLLATAASTAARNGVGLFAPGLFAGALTGVLFGDVVQAVQGLSPDLVAPEGAYGLVGMAAVAGALTQAPITMVLMLFEMTGNYQIILPVLLALAVSGVVTRAADRQSIFSEQLRQRGLSLARPREELVMYELRVKDIMRSSYPSLPVGAPFSALASCFLSHRVDDVYVLDEQGRLHGLINIQDIKGLLGAPEGVALADVERRSCPTLSPDSALADALPLLCRHEDLDELPVVGAYNREVLRKETLLARIESGPIEERQVDFLELPEGYRMDIADVPPGYAGRTLRELRLPARAGLTVIAVDAWDEGRGAHKRVCAEVDHVLGASDRIVVLGPAEAVAAFTGRERRA